MHPHFSKNPRFRKRFLREVQVAMEFVHEHAVQIRDFGETEDGFQYFTMDFCSGTSLRGFLERESGTIAERKALEITRQILSALQNG